MSPQPPPEAQIIARKRKAMIPRPSYLEAGRRAGISATRWRQLEQGFIRIRGKDYPETAPHDTLARMAFVVGVTPAELEEAGRPEAADRLRRLAAAMPENGAGGDVRALIEQVGQSRHFTERQKRALVDRIMNDLTGGA